MTRRKPQAAFKRDEPDLPFEFESNAEGGQVLADGGFVTVHETLLSDLDRPNLKIDTFRVEGSILERIKLSDGQFGSTVWKDVRLIGCDLANVRAHRMSLVRVEFVDCRLTGFSATALDWQDVLVRTSDAQYAQVKSGSFRSCEFDRCNWQEADLQNADLTGSVFRSCNLARADLHGAKLQSTDFRKSEVEGMVVGIEDLRGAIVDPAQAMVFAQLLGLQIA